jgi:hypothetical protein
MPVITLISTALLLDSIIRNSVCTPAKLPCRRVEVGYCKMYHKRLNWLCFFAQGEKEPHYSIQSGSKVAH